MNKLIFLRWAAATLLLMLLGGCAGNDVIRGRLNFDLRPEAERTVVYWPALPEVPRYRYLGELVGEPNFEDVSDKSGNLALTALRWIAGIFEARNPLMLARPQHGAISEKGRIYVVDAGHNAVFVFDPQVKEDEKSDRGEGRLQVWESAGEHMAFAAPVAVAMVWGDDVAVSDAKLGAVLRIKESGELVGTFGSGQLRRPTGLAFDREDGLLFVSDTAADNVKVYDEAGRLVNTIGASGAGEGEFNAPTHLAFSEGHLYVTDTFNNRIQVFDAKGHRIREFGERGVNVGNLARPKGVAVGDAEVVYVVESYFNHLLVFNHSSDFLLGISGSGLKNGKFFLPAGVWTDRKGRVFVADMFNGRVVVFQFIGGDGG